MDLSRYLDVATRGRLFFCRQDKFRDTFEGAIPSISRQALVLESRQFAEDHNMSAASSGRKIPSASLAFLLLKELERARCETFISCWHMNLGESAAMWDLYGRDGSAIAFRTSYIKLRDALPSNAYLGMVNYIDFETGFFALNNVMNPSMYKRRSFEHEKEVRAVLQFLGDDPEDYALDYEMTEFGLTVPFDVNASVDEIYLSPDAKPWFVRLLQETNSKLGITPPLKKSSLYDAAIF